MNIIILGAGAFGWSLSKVLVENNHNVTLWTPFKEQISETQLKDNKYAKKEIVDKLQLTTDISEINNNDVIVYVVPSFALRETAQKVKEVINDKKVMVLCTKGIEANTLKTGYEILTEELGITDEIVILSGPTHAEEIVMGKYTTIVSTSTNKKNRELVQDIFNNKIFRVYTNDDIRGVEISGAVKNILAIGAGICEGQDFCGDNAKAALITRGLRELKILVEHDNGDINTIYGLTGLGDLLVTAYSKYSRNGKFGELYTKGYTIEEAQKEIGQVVEGLYAVKSIYNLKEKYNLDLPIISGIYEYLYVEKDINILINKIQTREQKSEQ